MSQNNRRRALADVVAVEAWHEQFSVKLERTDLHVDVVFSNARVGGDGEAVRFKLALKEAEVVVVIPPGEPASIDPRGTARDTPKVEATASTKKKLRKSASASFSASGAVAGTRTKGKAGIKAQADAAMSDETTIAMKQALAGLSVTHSSTPEGEPRWIVSSNLSPHLEGRPWDAKKAPRLKLIDERGDRSKGIAPSVRIEVRCRREDLIITDITLKDETVWQAVTEPFLQNRLKAAEAVIRTRLFEEGLLCGDLDDPYARMTLAATTAEAL